jgi:hypothetical protein
VLGTVFGVAVLLALVAVAADVAIDVLARTRVESIAYEAARHVATAPADAPTETVRAVALERACHLLGDRCDEVGLAFLDRPGDAAVVIRVTDPAAFGLDRRIRVHKEFR